MLNKTILVIFVACISCTNKIENSGLTNPVNDSIEYDSSYYRFKYVIIDRDTIFDQDMANRLFRIDSTSVQVYQYIDDSVLINFPVAGIWMDINDTIDIAVFSFEYARIKDCDSRGIATGGIRLFLNNSDIPSECGADDYIYLEKLRIPVSTLNGLDTINRSKSSMQNTKVPLYGLPNISDFKVL